MGWRSYAKKRLRIRRMGADQKRCNLYHLCYNISKRRKVTRSYVSDLTVLV
jgi:hypothetical protein